MSTDSLFSWEQLQTIGGASLLVFFIVQYTKEPMVRCLKFIPTDLYAVFVAFFILVTASAATENQSLYDWRLYVLSFFNSFIVASTSSHVYAKTKSPPITRKSKEAKKEAEEVESFSDASDASDTSGT